VAAPLLALLAAKNELTKLGKGLFETLTRGDDTDFLAHQRRLETSYALICFTSFFEALDHKLPDQLRNRLRLSPDEKQLILKGSLEKTNIQQCPTGDMAQRSSERQPPFSVSFPHPVQDLDSLKADLKILYTRLSKGFLAFLEKLALWDNTDASEKEKLLKDLGALPDLALIYFLITSMPSLRHSSKTLLFGLISTNIRKPDI